VTDTATTPTADEAPNEEPAAEPAEDDGLGDAGKKALAAERATAKAAEKRAKAAEAELERVRLENASAEEKAIAAARAEGRTEALATANVRLVRAEVKAAAGGVLQDPEDAVRLLDLAEFGVDDDGEVDTKAITAAVRRLAESKPYLAVGAKPTALPGGGATPSQGFSMDDLIRRKARGH
jgi:hypothetical protein